MFQRLTSFLKDNKTILAIIGISLILRLLWLTTLIGRDEGMGGYVGWLWTQGKILYVNVFDNKGPFYYFLYGAISYIFGPSMIFIRLFNDFLFIISIIMIYRLATDWYGEMAGIISATFYGIFLNAPIYEGQLVVSESIALPLLVGTVYFWNSYLKVNQKKFLILSGILMSLSFLTRQTTGLMLPIMLIMLIFFNKKNENASNKSHIQTTLSNLSGFFLGIAIPIAIISLYFQLNNAFPIFLDKAFIKPFDYFKGLYVPPSGESTSLVLPYIPLSLFLVVIAQGLPLWIFGCLGTCLAAIRRSIYDKLILLWFIIFCFVVSRPPSFGHYFQQIIPPMSMLAGTFISQITNGISKEKIKRIFTNKKFSETEIAAISVIALLLMTSIPAAYIQSIQFPNYNIKWEFIEWRFADGQSFENQSNLAQYLKTTTPRNSKILVYGWASEIYWMSGFESPVYPWSYPPTTLPKSEYQYLVQLVQNSSIDRVILFAQSRAELSYRLDDPIVNNTLRKYFFEKQIDNAWIFSKYDSKGRYVAFDLVDMLNNASSEYIKIDGSFGNTSADFSYNEILIPAQSILDINGDIRYAIRQHPLPLSPEPPHIMVSRIAYDLTLPSKPVLNFSIGMHPAIWNMSDGVEFRIFVEDNGNVQEIFVATLDPKENSADRRWVNYELNLAEYANEHVRVIFETLPGEKNNSNYDWAFWGTPTILNSN